MITFGPSINQEAAELNKTIEAANPEIMDLLTPRGLRAYFPNQGIVKQSLEAKKHGKNFNASIGVALADDGQPLVFDEIRRLVQATGVNLAAGINYGSSSGLQPLRETLRDQMDIEGVGLPVITNGLTHGLANWASLFCDEDTAVVIHSFFWENIQLLFQDIYGATFVAYPFFNQDRTGYNLEGLVQAITQAHQEMGRKKVAVYLNFPNNPTGYNLSHAEGEGLRAALGQVLDANPELKVVVIDDEAYFGLSYEGATERAIASYLVNAHPRLLTVAAKGPTKEVNVWGLRVGALWCLPYGMKPEVIGALNEKLAGTTRGLISMPSVLGQEMVAKVYLSQTFLENKKAIKETMGARAAKMKEILGQEAYRARMPVFPFNAGYFCCCAVPEAESVRQRLLKAGGGVIAGCEYNNPAHGGNQYIRLAFSCLPEARIPEVLETVLKAV